ncbi:MAG: hypothetical protein HYT68_00700 [Candidatus Zambryskibacteria bacterium]|nr:hypothetical protein [Candidatus Zambryskibacteria bacterium]
MITISVPITPKQEKFINSLIKSGKVANRAHAVRQAISLMEEEELIERLLKSQQEARDGKVLRGDLRELIKKF